MTLRKNNKIVIVTLLRVVWTIPLFFIVSCIGANGPSPLQTADGRTIEIPIRTVDGGSSGLNKDSTKDATTPNLIVFDSKLYLVWTETDGTATQIRARVYNGNDDSPSWSFVDGGISTGLNKNSTQNATSPFSYVFNSKFYLTWIESSGTKTQVRVAVYNGNDSTPTWTFVDGNGVNGINKDTNENATKPYLIAFNSKLYITWQEESSGTSQIRIAVYNGNDGSPTWTFVDGNAATGLNKDTDQSATTPRLGIANSKLYLSFDETDGTAKQIRARVYNGDDASPSWSFVDGNLATGINKDTTKDGEYPSLAEKSNHLYCIWQESNGSKTQIRAAVYNGDDSSPSWSFVDGDGGNGINLNTSQNATHPQLINSNSTLYSHWLESNGTADQVRILVYNSLDSSPVWYFLDGGNANGLNRDSTQNASGQAIANFNDKMYTVWSESNGTATLIRASVGDPSGR